MGNTRGRLHLERAHFLLRGEARPTAGRGRALPVGFAAVVRALPVGLAAVVRAKSVRRPMTETGQCVKLRYMSTRALRSPLKGQSTE